MTRPSLLRPFAILVLFAPLFLVSCGRERETSARTPVSWPELDRLDVLAKEVATLAEKKDKVALLKTRTALLEAGWAVSHKSKPMNAANPDEVDQLLVDLSSVVNAFAQSEMPDERLFALATDLPSVVNALIEAAGSVATDVVEGVN